MINQNRRRHMTFLLIQTSLIAFISSMIGGSVPLLRKKSMGHYKIMHQIDSICDGMFIGIALTHFIPELYHHTSVPAFSGYMLLIGLTIFVIQHLAKQKSSGTKNIITALLFSHCFLEGMAVSVVANAHLQASLSFAILAHKIVESFVFFNLVSRQNWGYKTLISLLITFSLLTPFGIFVGQFLSSLSDNVYHFVNALTCGAFLGIGLNCYLLHSCNDKSHSSKIWLLAGFILLYLIMANMPHHHH